MSDEELKQVMRAIATVSGVPLSEERLTTDLPAYKRYLASIEAIRRVELPLEAEPAAIFTLLSKGRQ
jgi:hypothetical protein